MKLGEAGLRVRGDHGLGIRHRALGGKRFPGVGSEMIAAENDSIGVEPRPPRDGLDHAAKSKRSHSGVAAILVYLVASGFDQRRAAGSQGKAQMRFYDQGMGGADRGYARVFAVPEGGGDVKERVLHRLAPPDVL